MAIERGELTVVGGGAVGLACALRLQEAGWRTTVIDADAEPFAASWGNAGCVALEQVEPMASPTIVRSAAHRLFAFGGPVGLPAGEILTWGPWALKFLKASKPERFEAGRRALAALSAEAGGAWRRLARDVDAEGLYEETGHLLVWETAGTAKARRKAWDGADKGSVRVEPMGPGAIERVATRVRKPIAGGIRFFGTGRIRDLQALKGKLQTALKARGGVIEQGVVERLVQDGGRIAVVLKGGGARRPERVLLAAGANSGRLLAGLRQRVPLIAERGYHIHDPQAQWPTELAPLVFEDRAVVLNRFADGLRLTGFFEFARPDTPPDPRKWKRLRRHAAELGLPFGPEARTWMGSRPTLPDYLPAIGLSRRPGGLVYAFGHQHLGLTLSAITAELVAAALDEATPAVDLEPFDIERFA